MTTYKLNGEGISQAVNAAEQLAEGRKIDRKRLLQMRLTLEEVLLFYRDAFGEDATFILTHTIRMRRGRIALRISGAPRDPFAVEGDERSDVLRSLLSSLDLAPVWQYNNGVNHVTFALAHKKTSQVLQLGIAIAPAVVLGLACTALPRQTQVFITDDLVGPIFDKFMGLLSAVAAPMIFLSVVWGIYSIGDTATLSKVGKRMIARFIGISAVIAALVALLCLPFVSISNVGAGSGLDVRELLGIVLDIIPTNFFSPFTEGNPMQIIFVAVLLGIALLVLGDKTALTTTVVEQLSFVVHLIMQAVGNLVPIFVFACMFRMILSGQLAKLMQTYELVLVMLLGFALVTAGYLIYTSLRTKTSPVAILRALAPSTLIGLTTCSSAAAYTSIIDVCENRLGIDRRITNFGVPLGQVVFMPGCIVQFMVTAMFMAKMFDVPATPGWLLTAGLVVVVLSMAAPPVAGGTLTCYTMLLIQLNIPTRAIGPAIALNVVMEFIGTAVNVFCLQTELYDLARSLNIPRSAGRQ